MDQVDYKIGLMSISSLHDPAIQELQHVFRETEEWLLRAGRNVIRKFFLRLIQGNQDVHLIRRLIVLFSSASQKDFIYTRSRSNPGLPSDARTKSPKKEFSSKLIEECASKTWLWYKDANKHCKVLFILFIARLCADTGMAHQACNLCKTLLQRQTVSLTSNQAEEGSDDECESINSSTYTFHTDEHPELYQLASIVPQYSPVDVAALIKDSQPKGGRNEKIEKVKISRIIKKDVQDAETLSTSSHAMTQDSHICLITTSHTALSGVSKCCDFISLLPVHLSKGILGMMSRSDLSSCALVHTRWHDLVSQVRSDEFSLQIIKEEAILMQGISAKGSNPTYAKVRQVLVPVVDEETQNIVRLNPVELAKRSSPPRSDEGERIFESMFYGMETKFAPVEERNIFCGAYNLLVLDQRSNANRIISYAGGENMVIAFADKAVRTVDISSGREKKPSMHGHPASVTALHMGTFQQGCVFSGSYDTTIRKWNLSTGSCQLIMHGHRKSITCLDLSGDLVVSAAQDGLVKVWNVMTGACVCTFKHSKKSSVTCVQIGGETIASSCEKGYVKVWSLKTRKLVKTLNNHGRLKVNCVRFNEYFLVSGADDGYLLLWSLPGAQSICLKAYRHPKAVLCVELRYMCAITGCADGKIRVINMLSGDCLRVLRGNSQCDPIIAMIATENRLLVNTCSNCLVMHFEPIEWEYDSAPGQLTVNSQANKHARRPISSRMHSVVRANRMNLTSASDERIFKRTRSAPPAPSKKFLQKSVIHSAPVRRPASHYIDLQPEFRRPKSSVSAVSIRASRHNSATRCSDRPSRILSGKSDSRSTADGAVQEYTVVPSREKMWFKSKHSDTRRDSILMRVGMLHNVRRDSQHNVNTEINSISYFDRYYPRAATPLSRFQPLAIKDEGREPKHLVGRFTSDNEEIVDVKLVLKERVDGDEAGYPRLREVITPEPNLDPFRRNFKFMETQAPIIKESPCRRLRVDNFLHQQLGVTL